MNTPALERIIGIVSATLHIDARHQITGETTFDQLKLDAIDRATLAMEVEDAFGITIREDDEAGWSCLADIARAVSPTPAH